MGKHQGTDQRDRFPSDTEVNRVPRRGESTFREGAESAAEILRRLAWEREVRRD